MQKILYILFILFLSTAFSFAQKDGTTVSPEFQQEVDSLKSLLAQIFEFNGDKYVKNDSLKKSKNKIVLKNFEKLLNENEAFEYSFDSLKYVGSVTSEDKRIRIITWNLQYANKSFEYFGFILNKQKGSDTHVVIPLVDKSAEINDPENQVLSPDNWFGVLYYKIVTREYKSITYYTLLGWDGNDELSSKKIIDVLFFSNNGKVNFGAGIFHVDKKLKKRIVFEFSAKASLFLQYHEKDKRIVFEQLIPIKPSLQGQYKFYVPRGGTYDGLEFIDGKWEYIQDIVFEKKSMNGSPVDLRSNDFYNRNGSSERQ